jgi:hypothetical protein
MKQATVVSIMTRLWAGRLRIRGLISGRGNKIVLFFKASKPTLTHSASYSMGTGGTLPGDKAAAALTTHLPSAVFPSQGSKEHR